MRPVAWHVDGQGSLPAFTPNCSSISTRYPLASLFVSFAECDRQGDGESASAR